MGREGCAPFMAATMCVRPLSFLKGFNRMRQASGPTLIRVGPNLAHTEHLRMPKMFSRLGV